jgi:acyl dehydratase
VLVTTIYRVEARMALNYGLDRVRFPSPVRVGSKVRATTELLRITPVPEGVQVVARTTIEIENSEKPGCVAENVSRYYW